MMFTSKLRASDPQVDIFRPHLVEESEDAITTHNLTIEVVRLEGL